MLRVDAVSEEELLERLLVVIFVHVARWILDYFLRLLVQGWVLELLQFHPVLVLLAELGLRAALRCLFKIDRLRVRALNRRMLLHEKNV